MWRASLSYCTLHSEHTCCEQAHVSRIFSKVNEHNLSLFRNNVCKTLTTQVLCSTCDGDVGTGIRANNGSVSLCPTFCNAWFQACKDEYWLRRGHTELVPCNNDAGCQQLRNLVAEGADFCEAAFHNFQKFSVGHIR